MTSTLFLLITAFTCSFLPSIEVEKKEIDFKTIEKEIEWFIDKVNRESYKQGKHNVYAFKIYEGEHVGDYCFTLGYIVNFRSIRHIENFKYYLLINEDLIVMDYSKDFKEKFSFKNADNIKIFTNKQIIVDKVNRDVEVLGTSGGYVCCYHEGNIIKVYYENSEEIPSHQALFKITNPAQGTIIEVDSSTFKQIHH